MAAQTWEQLGHTAAGGLIRSLLWAPQRSNVSVWRPAACCYAALALSAGGAGSQHGKAALGAKARIEPQDVQQLVVAGARCKNKTLNRVPGRQTTRYWQSVNQFHRWHQT